MNIIKYVLCEQNYETWMNEIRKLMIAEIYSIIGEEDSIVSHTGINVNLTVIH